MSHSELRNACRRDAANCKSPSDDIGHLAPPVEHADPTPNTGLGQDLKGPASAFCAQAPDPARPAGKARRQNTKGFIAAVRPFLEAIPPPITLSAGDTPPDG